MRIGAIYVAGLIMVLSFLAFLASTRLMMKDDDVVLIRVYRQLESFFGQ